MFKYFPTNYVWNLSVDLAIEMGARMGEIEAMCAPLQEAAKAPDAAGTAAFRETWARMADKLCELAAEDEAAGRALSAGEKYSRAATYYLTAERLQAHGAPGRTALYGRFLEVFAKGLQLGRENCTRVEIPYEGKQLSALYVRAEGVNGPAPILVQVNGLDSTKEMKYRVGLPSWLSRRGVSSLIVDQPGTGEALRFERHRTSSFTCQASLVALQSATLTLGAGSTWTRHSRCSKTAERLRDHRALSMRVQSRCMASSFQRPWMKTHRLPRR